MSIASSINKLVTALLGENFTGDVIVTLKKNSLRITAGRSELNAVTDGVIYQLAEKEVSVLKEGSFIFKVSDGYLASVTAAPEAAPAADKPKKTVTGGNSSARENRSFD